MKLLITGGAGYIGSHTVLELLKQDHDIVVMDNLSNASLEALKRVEKITGKSVTFYEVDLRDKDGMDQIFSKEKIEGVIHFAGLKAVGESVEKPLMYYENNVSGTVNLLQVMAQHNVK
ncbi:MAG TPA: SDR family NAD(P)-dependent oxidoreductase, partial [Erysipelothrix sp.]